MDVQYIANLARLQVRPRSAAFGLAVGSPHETRSHFDAQDFMNHGAPGDRTVHSGWLNRYLVATQPEDAARNEFRDRFLSA